MWQGKNTDHYFMRHFYNVDQAWNHENIGNVAHLVFKYLWSCYNGVNVRVHKINPDWQYHLELLKSLVLTTCINQPLDAKKAFTESVPSDRHPNELYQSDPSSKNEEC